MGTGIWTAVSTIGLVMFIVGLLWGAAELFNDDPDLSIVLILFGIAPFLIAALLYPFRKGSGCAPGALIILGVIMMGVASSLGKYRARKIIRVSVKQCFRRRKQCKITMNRKQESKKRLLEAKKDVVSVT